MGVKYGEYSDTFLVCICAVLFLPRYWVKYCRRFVQVFIQVCAILHVCEVECMRERMCVYKYMKSNMRIFLIPGH